MNLLNPEIYTIAWIAPLEIEARAALEILDRQHEGRFPLGRNDGYVYLAGEICNHNVTIATLPDDREYGTGAATAIASQVKMFFPDLWLGLLVGVAAGLPNLHRAPPLDIRLGDVLVALPEGDHAGLIEYDLGKETGDNGFQLLRHGHILNKTKDLVLTAIKSIKLRAPDDTEVLLPYYEHLKDKQHNRGLFADPGQENDVLFEIDDEGNEYQVSREPRPTSRRTYVWYGPIGTGDKLMKNARKRNELRDRYNVIGLEMEAAGTMNCIAVGVIRGVCDYGDEHKHKEWQPYAAAMSASYTKAVLAQIPPKVIVRVEGQIIEDDTPSKVPSRPNAHWTALSPPPGSRTSKSSRRGHFNTPSSRLPSPRHENSNTTFSRTPPIQARSNEDRIQTLLESLSFD